MTDRTQRTTEARHAIEEIVLGYADAVDSADLERVAELLDAATVHLPGGAVLEGGEAVHAAYAETMTFYDDRGQVVPYQRRACSPRLRHVTSNLRYQFDEAVTEARTECYVTVLHTLKAPAQVFATGRYLDRFVHDGEAWKIVERKLILDTPVG